MDRIPIREMMTNEDAPIGYFVIKGDLADMGVIHQ